MKLGFILSLTFITGHLIGQTPCKNGMAGSFPCNQITLQSHVTLSELDAHNLNDIWGWTDSQTGKEYVLVGLTEGVTFVDITSPVSPIVIGKLGETHTHGDAPLHGESSWRDLKVFNDHVFIISDGNSNHGMQVFDLTNLRGHDGSTFQSFEHDFLYEGIGSSHNIVINEETEFAYIVGVSSGASTCGGGGLHILDIKDPKNPEYIACFDEDGYTHDAQCIIYTGPDTDYTGREICFNSNEDSFTIVDVNDKSDMSMISRTSYGQVEYAHQGWLTEDQRYFLMNDELDELEGHFSHPRTLIWNVEDLDRPVLLGEFYNEEVSIDHNLYTKGNLIFESNYSSGLRVLSSERVSEGILREVAFFDTEPAGNAINFNGTWSNYPYFESGNIAVSDINNGLFILSLDLSEVITTHPESVSACEGSIQNFSVETSDSDLTYQWQIQEDDRFVDLIDNDDLSGAQTQDLELTLIESVSDRTIRTKITTQDGSTHLSFPAKITFSNSLPGVGFDGIFFGNTVNFTNKSTNADSYLWDFGDGNTSNEENPSHNYGDISNYEVTLTATNSCGDVSETQNLFVVTATEELPQDWLVYPVPATNVIHIELSGSAGYQLHDLSGKVVKEGSLSNSGKQSINIESIQKGYYILSLSTRSEQFSTRILKK
ncbi:MAG: choice-of-anchor B family protein [Cyclobacteriaceae bacterium]